MYMFYFEYERPAQKRLFHSFRKAQSQKGGRKVKQARKFLIKFSFTRAPYVGAERVCLNTFTTQKWFRLTCTSITSCKIHFKLSQSSNPLQKSHTEPIFCFAWIPIVDFDNYSEVGDRRFVNSIQQTAYYSTQNDFHVPPIIRNIIISMKKPFRRSNSQKT